MAIDEGRKKREVTKATSGKELAKDDVGTEFAMQWWNGEGG